MGCRGMKMEMDLGLSDFVRRDGEMMGFAGVVVVGDGFVEDEDGACK